MIRKNEIQESVKAKFENRGNERAVLSCILRNPDTLIDVQAKLKESDFLSPHHRALYSVLCSLYSNGVSSFDLVIVTNALEEKGMLDLCGKADYINVLFETPVDRSNLGVFIDKILDSSIKYNLYRETVYLQNHILNNTSSSEDSVSYEELLARAESRVLDVSMEAQRVDDAVLIGEGLQERLEELASNPKELIGLSTGIELLDQATSGLVPGSLTVLAARPKVGKCLTGDTLILDASSGELKPIKSFSGTVASFTGGKFIESKIYGPISSGKKAVFEIKTRLGNTIKCTDNHPFYTVYGWGDIKSGGVSVGSRIATPSSLPFFGKNSAPKGDLALLGYWYSEGCKKSQKINAKRESVKEDIRESCVNSCFDCVVADEYVSIKNGTNVTEYKKIVSSTLTRYLSDKNLSTIEFSKLTGVKYTTLYNCIIGKSLPSREVLLKFKEFDTELSFELTDIRGSGRKMANPIDQVLTEYGVNSECSALDKYFSPFIMGLSKDCMAYFLNRLYSGDGWVTKKEVGYSTSSLRLAKQLKNILLRFSIPTRLRTKKNTYYKNGDTRVECPPNYNLIINKNRYIHRFMDIVGCIGRVSEYSIVENLNDGDVFGNPPKEFSQEIIKRAKSIGITYSELDSICGKVRRDVGMSHKRAQKAAALVEDTYLYATASDSLVWDEVLSINYVGEEETYDLQVLDGDPNFIAEDIVVHNSSLLMNMACNVAFKQVTPLLYVDTEMTTGEVQMRLLSHLSGVPEKFIKTGKFIENEAFAKNVWKAAEVIKRSPYYHRYYPGFSIEGLKTLVRKFKVRYDIGTFFFDYIKMDGSSNSQLFKEHQALGFLTTALKDIAGTLDIPVVTAAQVKREDSDKSKFSDSAVADSDRIGRYCNTLLALGRKTRDEIEKDGIQCGTHRLQILLNRGGSSMYHGIDLYSHLPTLTFRQAEWQSNGAVESSTSGSEF